MTSQARRDQKHAAMRDEIKDIAWRQMQRDGVAALSLRAIARQMEVTAPALYRYFPTRDDLITALIMDAVTDLAVMLEDVEEAHQDEPAGERLLAMCLAYREWVLANPIRFTLMSDVRELFPDYEYVEDAPYDVLIGKRILSTVAILIAEGWEEAEEEMPRRFRSMVSEQDAEWRKDHEEKGGWKLPFGMLALGLMVETHGFLKLEVAGNTSQLIGFALSVFKQMFTEREEDFSLEAFGLDKLKDPGVAYRLRVEQILSEMGLIAPHRGNRVTTLLEG